MVMEAIAFFGCPPFPKDIRLIMKGPHFLQNFLSHANIFLPDVSFDQLTYPEFSLSHLSANVILDGIDLVFRLLLSPVFMAADAGIPEHISCASLAVEGKGLSLFVLHLRHMAIFEFDACPFRGASPEGF